MNCVELRESLTEAEYESPEQRAHLKSCRECSELVAELATIASAAVELSGANEPSPRVWNSIEIALRREGLIRPQTAGRSLFPSFAAPRGWMRWMLPAAAVLLITVGVYLRQHATSNEIAENSARPVARDVQSDMAVAGLNDDDLMQEMAQQSPALQAQYSDNLRRVNQYIQDAKNVVAADPNDEEARRSLMEAYQEKSMLFELALDRSLP
ncbi:MAG TPA: anti-sigma factor [Candidatus Sulfotelmatobacter sp.]|nr:anti-sigma factor [Candidatus Sulfotelmatobacter sp.]